VSFDPTTRRPRTCGRHRGDRRGRRVLQRGLRSLGRRATDCVKNVARQRPIHAGASRKASSGNCLRLYGRRLETASRAPPPESARDGQLVDANIRLRTLAETTSDPGGPVFSARSDRGRLSRPASAIVLSRPRSGRRRSRAPRPDSSARSAPVAAVHSASEIDDGVLAANQMIRVLRLPVRRPAVVMRHVPRSLTRPAARRRTAARPASNHDRSRAVKVWVEI